MKKIIFVLLISMFLISCDNETTGEDIQEGLSESVIKDLQYLKEEEKLARDVYLYAYDVYQLPVFNNISRSEQSHMDQVTKILTAYRIEDLSLPERGKFTNKELQGLYNDLTALVDQSVTDALIAGATIEDLDISDIDEFIEAAPFDDILEMYRLLECGSENHMRAFTRSLNTYDITYEPQFITEEKYQTIINAAGGGCVNL